MASSTGIELLLVEDNPDDAQFVERLVSVHQAALSTGKSERLIEIESIEHVDCLSDGLDRVSTGSPDIVLLDLMLPDSSGLETVEAMVERAPTVPIVVLTGRNDTTVSVEAIRCGAQDYLVKGTITTELLLRTLRYAIERARAQRELLDRNHRLTLLNRIVRTDIRNDVSIIVGWGDQLRERIDEDDSAAVEALLEASHHALELTDTAAELMDVLSADPQTEPEACDVTAVLDAEIERLKSDRDGAVSVDRVGLDEPVIVYASPMLGSVFKHLLTNAATSTDGTIPRITVILETTSDRARVKVAEDGVGIPDAQKEALVDPDARFDDHSGMGTGLYLVTSVLELFGGELEIDDRHPRGSVVSVSFERVS